MIPDAFGALYGWITGAMGGGGGETTTAKLPPVSAPRSYHCRPCDVKAMVAASEVARCWSCGRFTPASSHGISTTNGATGQRWEDFNDNQEEAHGACAVVRT